MLTWMQRTPSLLGPAVLAAGVVALSLVAAAAGRTSVPPAKVKHVHGRLEALAVDGTRIAYDVGPESANRNKVVVWNVRTGKTTTVSGNRTRHADDSSTGSGVFQLAIAGTRVAWLVNEGGNTEGDDYLFASSVVKPKERQIASVVRYGDSCPGRSEPSCAGDWLGGLVGSGGMLAFNRWTTDGTGSATDGALNLLVGTKTKQIATGADTVEAVSADGGRVAVLRSDGTVALYSSPSGTVVRVVSPASIEEVALSGHNLVVLTRARTLELYNTESGNRRKVIPVQGSAKQKPGNLDVQGKIAIYTTGSRVHAVNLSSRKDRVIGKLGRAVGLARVDAAGVAYTSNRLSNNGTLVFVPWARVKAAVR